MCLDWYEGRSKGLVGDMKDYNDSKKTLPQKIQISLVVYCRAIRFVTFYGGNSSPSEFSHNIHYTTCTVYTTSLTTTQTDLTTPHWWVSLYICSNWCWLGRVLKETLAVICILLLIRNWCIHGRVMVLLYYWRLNGDRWLHGGWVEGGGGGRLMELVHYERLC